MNDERRQQFEPTESVTDELTRRLDRLVDGELNLAQQRSLLKTIDAVPGGWKRCALAFLESRAWEEALAGTTSDPASTTRTVTGRTERRRPAARRSWWVAAASVAAMLVGMVIGGQTARWRTESVSPVAGAGDARQAATEPRDDPAAWRLVVDTADGKTVLPVYSPDAARAPNVGETASDRWWNELSRELKQVGQPLDERQRWYSVSLDDGRQVLIPVDELRLPVGAPEAPARTVSHPWSQGDETPELRRLESWLQGTTAGRLRVIRIGPGVLFGDPSRQLRELEWARAEARLERLERQLDELQALLQEALGERHGSP